MAIRGELKGAEVLSRQLARYGESVAREAQRVVAKAANDVRNRAVLKIQRSPATGAVYDTVFATIGGRVIPMGPRAGNNLSATHQASAPGEPPASDTGILANSVDVEISGLTARVGTGIDYGRHLEFGTLRVAPRPWLEPSLRETQDGFRKDLVDALNGIKP